MPAKEQAIVVPPKGAIMNYPKSRFEHLHTPFRCLCVGKSGSGKSAACYNAIVNFYRGCFSKIFIVSRSANLDHTFIMLREWAEKHLGQDNKQERFVFTSLAESSEDLMRIFLEHEKLVAKEKHQRKADKSKAPLSAVCWILDDVTDESALRDREGFLPRLFTTSRHSGQSIWLSCHQLVAVSPLLRKNASMLIIFKIASAIEMQKLAEEFSWLVGRHEFQEMYDLAAGKRAPPFSFLTIMTLEQDPAKMFYARLDQRLFVEEEDAADAADASDAAEAPFQATLRR
jgi:hypothetical protein